MEQTRLSDFDEIESSEEEKRSSPRPRDSPHRREEPLWQKMINEDEKWGVCRFDDTVFFTKIVDGRLHAYGLELTCKWCGDTLGIREDKVFCTGTCRRYQGEFSRNLNAYLWWEGAKSYTLRHEVAEAENLELEPRDLEDMSYAPKWSVLSEYDEDELSSNYSKE
ncbi:hypothetical protein EU545_04645 [Candidatus Thorarchaeota archaeon]|nr:MAG: hypothetical protein EU545_04645 [Candidatus Thorarchaeota archaeon]